MTIRILLLAFTAITAGSLDAFAQAVPRIRFHFISVGQADCTLVEAPCGAVLIDAGSQSDEHTERLVAYLESFFARRTDLNRTLELIGITHNHIDHTRALRRIVENFTVKRYIDNGQVEGMGTQNPLWVRSQINSGQQRITLKEITHAEVLAAGAGTGLTDDTIDPLHCPSCDPKIRVLWGRRDEPGVWSEDDFRNKNNHSIVWRIDFGELSQLITGDLEEIAIADLVDQYAGTSLLDVDIYHVGHHGSHNGTTDLLMDAMTPTRAVISMGEWTFGQNGGGHFTTFAYGHPRWTVVTMLANHVARTRPTKTVKVARRVRDFADYPLTKAVYGTGWDGTIVMSSGSDSRLRITLGQ